MLSSQFHIFSSAISVAAAHGQRAILHQLLTHPLSHYNKEVLSLEEILAEGVSQLTSDRRTARLQVFIYFFGICVFVSG